jgi:hypothetical protein
VSGEFAVLAVLSIVGRFSGVLPVALSLGEVDLATAAVVAACDESCVGRLSDELHATMEVTTTIQTVATKAAVD